MSKHTERLELIATDKLIPYANNARTHSDEQIKKIQASLREFGFVNPVLVDKDCGIIAGHGRVEAAKREGMTEVPCVWVEHLTEAQKKAYILADNRLAEMAGWDMELLSIELEELKELDFDIDLLGFDDIGEEEHETVEDDYEVELPEEPKTKLGDIYQLRNHRLMCGDSTDRKTVERLMAGVKADMVFTDPPYGYEYQSNMRTKTEKFDVLKNDDKVLNFMPLIPLVSNGFVFICTTWKVLNVWLTLFMEHFELTNMVVWDKGGGALETLKKTFSTDYEIILISHRGNELKGKRIGSVWNVPKDSASDYEHATQKPIKLSSLAIDETTNVNDTVLDLFGGSGSTLIACEQLNRTCYMMELDPKYCDVIINRWEQFTGEKAVKI